MFITNSNLIFSNITMRTWTPYVEPPPPAPVLDWQLGTLPLNRDWRAMTFGGGLFLAPAYTATFGQNNFIYSSDGENWSSGVLPISGAFFGTAYSGTRYVIISSGSSTAVRSDIGTGSWSTVNLGLSSTWQKLVYGNGRFVATSFSNNQFTTSTDGIAWGGGTLPVTGSRQALTYGNGLFVSPSYTGGSEIIRSSNGSSWNSVPNPYSGNYFDAAYGSGVYVSLAQGTDKFIYSSDAITWQQGTLPISASWGGIIYGSDRFVGLARGSNIYVTSLDGINWQSGTLPISGDFIGIAYGAGKFVALSRATNQYVYAVYP